MSDELPTIVFLAYWPGVREWRAYKTAEARARFAGGKPWYDIPWFNLNTTSALVKH